MRSNKLTTKIKKKGLLVLFSIANVRNYFGSDKFGLDSITSFKSRYSKYDWENRHMLSQSKCYFSLFNSLSPERDELYRNRLLRFTASATVDGVK